MAIREIKQNNFLAGIVNDPRANNPAALWYAENMEVGKNKSIFSVVNNQAENALSFLNINCITKMIDTGANIYGVGNYASGINLYSKPTDLSSAWASCTGATIAGGTFYKDNGFFAIIWPYVYFYDIYHANIARWYVFSPFTLTANYIYCGGTLLNSYGYFQGGVPWQGKLYGWVANIVFMVDYSGANNGTITQMINVDAEQTIVDIVPYQDNLKIVCSSGSSAIKSLAYLWNGDKDSTFIGIYEIGAGTVFGATEYEGKLIVAIAAANKKYFSLKYFNGVNYKTLFNYSPRANLAGTYAYISPASKLKVFGNYIYFLVTGTKPNDSYAGYYQYALARYGHDDPSNPLAFSIFKTFDFANVTRGLDGQVVNNDFLILEGVAGGASSPERYVAAVIYSDTNKTTFFLSAASTYSGQSGIVETLKFDGGDPSIPKQLKSVSLSYGAIPASGSVTLKYRLNSDTAWTTIFTDSTAGSCTHAAVNIESSGVNFDSFYEVQFRIEILGSIELKSFKAKYETTDQPSY
jgi:hypothetical protein